MNSIADACEAGCIQDADYKPEVKVNCSLQNVVYASAASDAMWLFMSARRRDKARAELGNICETCDFRETSQ